MCDCQTCEHVKKSHFALCMYQTSHLSRQGSVNQFLSDSVTTTDISHWRTEKNIGRFMACVEPWVLFVLRLRDRTIVHISESKLRQALLTGDSHAPRGRNTEMWVSHFCELVQSIFYLRELNWFGTLEISTVRRPVYENLYSPCKHGSTINSTNQDTNTNQIKTKNSYRADRKHLNNNSGFI